MQRRRLKIAVMTSAIALMILQPSAGEAGSPWVSRFTGKHVFGEGVGHDEGFTSLEWFLPLEQDSESEMWFGDVRGIMFDDAEFGANVGTGYRWHNPEQDRIYGFNGYWDFRNDRHLLFNQAGIGIESLGQIFDFRANGYTPTVNDADQRLPFSFVGNNLQLRELRALSGVDYEMAANLPDFYEFQCRVAGGGYYFDSSKTEAANGWRARIEMAFRDTVAASVAVQDDDVYGQTVNFTIEYRYKAEHLDALSRQSMYHKFRNESGSGDGRTIRHRLADPVYRQQNIVLLQENSLVTDGGGTPLTFLHVVEGGTGGGSFEMPYGTLSDAMADPLAPTSVVYTPQGGTFTENVTLVDATRLLSNGPQQFVESSIGSVQLPYSGAGSNLASLPSTIVGDVTVASNTEVSGFNISNGGLVGSGVSNVNVNQSAFTMSPADAITFTTSDAITLETLSIDSPVGRGILLDDTAATVSNVDITSPGDDGLQIDSTGTDRVVSLTNLDITDAGNEGIDVNVAGPGGLTLNSTMTSVTATNDAIDITTGPGIAVISLSDTTLESTAGAGLNADGSGVVDSLVINTLSNTTVTDAATGGLLFNTVTFDADPLPSVESGTTTIGSSGNRVTGRGVSLTDVTGEWDAGTLTIFNQNDTGLFANNSAPPPLFKISSGAGSTLDTLTGPALELDTMASSLVLDAITSADSGTRGIGLTTVTGSVTSGTTILSDSVQPSIRYENIALAAGTFESNLGAITIDSTIDDVEANNIEKVGTIDGLRETYTPLIINGP
ncbi:inverse autotransporter beta domain-containing protein [Fuerstiella marisgermanici]|uniref:Inverse autotransporter beta-domain domain-containing protein n=1 Tax=Fuerstiella marisgermanici TaxID=1891926 RepID=A0A1P8WRL6_9PLAN|nr:inverse autotransporter beta domain-containing protein [Fuerstiella marisgermanici]APZ96706.1 hypothetical protein Fuma_06379 [Fuerstiella marisgermanici]